MKKIVYLLVTIFMAVIAYGENLFYYRGDNKLNYIRLDLGDYNTSATSYYKDANHNYYYKNSTDRKMLILAKEEPGSDGVTYIVEITAGSRDLSREGDPDDGSLNILLGATAVEGIFSNFPFPLNLDKLKEAYYFPEHLNIFVRIKRQKWKNIFARDGAAKIVATYSFQVHRDVTPPVFTSVQIGSESTKYTDSNNYDWYKGDTEIMFQVDDNYPTGSGVSQVQQKINGASTWQNLANDVNTSIYRLVVNQEGVTEIQFRSLDNVGNIRNEGPLYIRIDNTGPDQVSTIFPQLITETDANGKTAISGLKVNWNSVVQDYPDGGCGVKGYDISWQRADVAAGYVAQNIDTLTTTEYTIPIENFERGHYYNVAIRSVDNLNNTKGWREIKNVFIPNKATINSVDYNPSVTLNNGNPEYQCVITLNQGSEILDHINAIKIYRDDTTEITAGVSSISAILDSSGRPRQPWGLNAQGKLTFTNKMVGKQFAHTRPRFTAYTVHAENLGAAVEYGNVFPTPGTTPPITPNYPADFSVVIKNGADTVLATMDKQGFIAGTQNAVQLNTKDRLYLSVTTPHNYQDAEGDSLTYSLYTINGAALTTGRIAATGSAIELFSDTSIAYELYLSVSEATQKYSSTPQSLSDPSLYGTNYSSQLTLHNNQNEGFYISFDTKPPIGAFKLVQRGNAASPEYSATHPPNTTAVAVLIEKGMLSDATGVVNSGIQKVLLWNLDLSKVKKPSYLTPEDIKLIGPTNPVEKAINITSGTAPLTDLKLDWNLTPGADGARVVAMQVTDGAGQEYYFGKLLFLDTTAPGLPAVSSFTHTQVAGGILLEWQEVEQGASYIIGYAPRPGAAIQYTTVTSSSITIPTNQYGPNQNLPVTLQTEDAAGNRSALLSYNSLYTAAEPGSLSGPFQDYNSASGHSLFWKLSGGTAYKQRLEILNTDGTVKSTLAPASGQFSINHLVPHATYAYQLAAYNSFSPPGGGDKTTGQLHSYTLANHAPSAPTNLSPVDYSGPNLVFSWKPSLDVDGDAVTYQLFYQEKGSATFNILGSTAGSSYTPQAGLFQGGREYTWYVVADDTSAAGGYTGLRNASYHASFNYDITQPTVKITNAPSALFTNQPSLQIQVSDNSGSISRMVYWTSDNQVSPQQPLAVTLTETEPGIFSGDAALHEANAPYSVIFQATDPAGNITQLSSPLLRVDRKAPVIQGIDIKLSQDNGRFLCNSSAVPALLHVQDNYAGTYKYFYAFVPAPSSPVTTWQPVQVEYDAKLEGMSGLQDYLRLHTLEGTDGTSYYLAIEAEDWAGNRSAPFYSPAAVFLDSTPPEAALSVDGFTVSGSSDYASDINKLNLTFDYQDPHSAVEAQYALIQKGQTENPVWYATWNEAKSGPLTAGLEYRIAARAINATGLISEKESYPFRYDNTAPVNLSVTVAPAASLVSGEALRIKTQAQDADSAIREFRLAIGLVQGGTELSQKLPGQSNGWLIKKAADPQAEFSFLLPEIADGSYTITLKAVNNAGLAATYVAPAALVKDNSQARMLVRDNGPYSGNSLLQGGWSYTGPEPVTGYQYRIMAASGSLIPWTATAQQSAEVANLILTEGESYWFEARAVFTDGSYSAVSRSLGVIPDFSPPLFAATAGFSYPAACTSQDLTISWKAADTISTISRVEALVETLDNQGKRYALSGDWVRLTGNPRENRVTLSRDAAGGSLALNTGEKVYVTLRLVNGAGLVAERSTAAIVIDNTPPPVPFVLDQGDVINAAQSLEAHWTWSKEDPESTTIRYLWTAYKAGQSLDQATWQQGSGDKTATIPPGAHLDIWYFAVKAVNGAGLESVGISNGILCDNTAPFAAQVKVIRSGAAAPDTALELNYVKDANALKLYIDSYDAESNIKSYSALSGTWNATGDWTQDPAALKKESAVNLIDLINSDFSSTGITVFRGECVNQADLVSEQGYSKGVMIDSEPPRVTRVYGYTLGDQLFFDWDVAESNAPVVDFSVAFVPQGTVPAATDYLSVGTARQYALNSVEHNIADGRYRLYVRAQNAAGTYSQEPGLSNEVILDHTPADLSRFSYPAYASHSVGLYLEAQDPLSGISQYSYAVGTTTDPLAYSGYWISLASRASLFTQAVSLENLASIVPDGAEIVVKIKVRNGAGIWTQELATAPIIVDKTAADLPLVSCPENSPYDIKVTGITISSQDLQSGITHYRVQVVTEKGLTSLDQATVFAVSNGQDKVTELLLKDFILEGLNLAENTPYYLAVQVKNGAGDWSEIGYSNAFVVDVTPPAIEFSLGTTEQVVNQPPAEVEYTVSEDAEIVFTLVLPGGGARKYAPLSVAKGTHHFTFTDSVVGIYELHARLKDKAGNEGNLGADASFQRIRFNAPPQVTLHDFFTTPGQPLKLSATVFDPDGDLPFSYSWDFGDGSALSTEAAPTHKFFHTVLASRETSFQVTLTVTDSQGKPGQTTASVTVRNTSHGTLYTNEVWSGTHYVDGDILVPGGITLTTAQGTVVIITGTPLSGYDHRITVKGSLQPGSATIFRMEAGVNRFWNGIWVSGQADFNGVTLKNAQRALTITKGARVTVTDSLFADNRTGIHILGNFTTIQGSRFEGNSVYGIKEDAGAEPEVTDCIFKDNLYDYYDDQATVIDMESLNAKPGNSGNIKE